MKADKAEMKAGLAEIKAEIKAEMKADKAEMKAELGKIRDEFTFLRLAVVALVVAVVSSSPNLTGLFMNLLKGLSREA
jgi:hypothetical protein